MKKHSLIIIMALSLSMTQCIKKDSNFLITENQVGPLHTNSKVADIVSIFKNDSIVLDSLKLKKGGPMGKIKVYETNGLHLLTLTANTDSVPTIENVQIFDPRYQTKKGIGLKSTFKDIRQQYTVQKVVTTFNNIVIIPKESNIYFTIDKEELPSNVRYTNQNIEVVQIPDEAKIKFLMLGWD